MVERTYIFNPDSISEEWMDLFDGIQAKKRENGSIELKFVKPTFINDSILYEWMKTSNVNKI